MTNESSSHHIAIIGMSGRFPGAANVKEFWRNLVAGIESISTFTDAELAASGLDVAALRKDPSAVAARGILQHPEWFDAAFFGMNAKQAEVTDPQQRLFLEASWEALESAGYDAARVDGPIGVFAGCGDSTYYLNHLHSRPDIVDLVGDRVINLGNEKDYLATWVAYKLNLRGPAISVNTACSTSLVAVCQASQSLLSYQCDIALAGGAWITFPQRRCVYFQEGGILSPDGHCRTFDARAQGTVSSEGLGVVVLKRLEEAVLDGDHIYAVIKGFGLNNDGAAKVGFTAPSVEGQAEAIATALADAEFDPDGVSYVECHGTATPIGDPIEITALTEAFRMGTDRKNFCAIGSVKSNIGHLGAGAGVAGLIKTALALENRMLPPSLHFSQPNPKIDFANSPFFVNSSLRKWDDVPLPRRAGVSSFGLGGTNAHVALEEAPEPAPSTLSRPWQLLLLSAKTAPALDAATEQLLAHFKANPDLDLADAAFTLQQGRQVFQNRRILVCRDVQDAITTLESRDPRRLITHHDDIADPSLVFMFPGQGAQHLHMGADLYRTEPVFRDTIDRCSRLLLPALGVDLRQVLYPEAEQANEAERLLTQTRITQPALFVIEYALASLWISWGVKPAAMIGHSIGEYVAACIAGVFIVEDALALVARRGELMQSMARGAMLAVSLREDELRNILPTSLSLAAVNGPTQCVVSGPTPEVEYFLATLSASGTMATLLHTSHAFHSGMMDPILSDFAECVSRVPRNQPSIPFVSNLTGNWVTAEEACDPQYWALHLRNTVRFADGVRELLNAGNSVLLEVGPGTTLSSLARLQLNRPGERAILTTSRHVREERSDVSCILAALGQLWLRGVKVDWSAFYAQERRRRILLPTYPFQRERYWVEPRKSSSALPLPAASRKNTDIADWFYVPSWKRVPPPQATDVNALRQNWLVFSDDCGLGNSLAERLASSQNVIQVRAGSNFTMQGSNSFVLNPSVASDYDRLLEELLSKGQLPQRIAHFWSVTPDLSVATPDAAFLQRTRSLGFDSLLLLAQSLHKCGMSAQVHIHVISNHVQDVIGRELLCPEKTLVLGPCKVIPQEIPNLICRSIDVTPGDAHSADRTTLNEQLVAELLSNNTDPVIAYRGRHRWVQEFEQIRLENETLAKAALEEQGVYLITGGLGKIGLALAEFLSGSYRAKLILLGRSALPPRDEWDKWLREHASNDDTTRRIHKLQQLEALGGEVLLLSVNVADRAQTSAGIEAAYRRFGRIDGVFHAAGIAGRGAAAFIPEIHVSDVDLHFRAKVHGTRVLEEIFKDKSLDFFALISSLSTVLGGLGTATYAAGNHFLDALAVGKNRSGGTPWLSINWDAWRNETGSTTTGSGAAIAEFSLTFAEGIDAFQRVLGRMDLGQIIVSTGDLHSRMDDWLKPRSIDIPIPSKTELPSSSQKRPEIRTEYVPAQNETERVVAGIWESLLGISQVGMHDNFFDLGGDSLLLLRVQVKIKQALHINLSAAEMFQHPTISTLARRLNQPNPESAGMEAVQDRAHLQRAIFARRGQSIKEA